jgi:hypothetical protein
VQGPEFKFQYCKKKRKKKIVNLLHYCTLKLFKARILKIIPNERMNEILRKLAGDTYTTEQA